MEEEDVSDEYVSYCRFRVDGIPVRQARSVGNTLRRTLLRQDLFRSVAPVAFRLRRRSFEVATGKVILVRAFYKWVVIPSYLSYHSVSLNSSSLKEWEIAPAFEEYRQRLRFDHWLMVPPLFSPVKKVNYLITGEEDQEVLQLEVWTTKSANASSLLRLASASLLAGLEARKGQISVPEPSELPGMRHANPPSGPLQGDDALAELLNSVQNDPSLISAGAAERDEDLSTLTQGLFDE
ncbi:unnamed protein product [Durusdinium trenchii]|uniref:Uncharacterized protein n=1 Tax=Durusdinium trenchii TaxID=1381693 RepID=A0ABP0NUX8_9DINO